MFINEPKDVVNAGMAEQTKGIQLELCSHLTVWSVALFVD